MIAVASFLSAAHADESQAKTDIIDGTWQDYTKDCGLEAQKANRARTEKLFREKYKGKCVAWHGARVVSVMEKENGARFAVGVSMNPTEAAFGGSDITLVASKVMLKLSDELQPAILALNKGDYVKFGGRFASRGGVLLNHQMDLFVIAPSKAEEKH